MMKISEDAKIVAYNIAPEPFKEFDSTEQELDVQTAAQHMLNAGMPRYHVEDVLRDLLSTFM